MNLGRSAKVFGLASLNCLAGSVTQGAGRPHPMKANSLDFPYLTEMKMRSKPPSEPLSCLGMASPLVQVRGSDLVWAMVQGQGRALPSVQGKPWGQASPGGLTSRHPVLVAG